MQPSRLRGAAFRSLLHFPGAFWDRNLGMSYFPWNDSVRTRRGCAGVRAGGCSAMLAMVLFFAAAPGSAQQLAWQPVGPPGGNVLSLAVSPARDVYLGAADGHVFVSQDGGANWSLRGRVSSRHDAVIQKLLVDAQRDRVLFAAVWFQDVRAGGALYRSDDAGATWTVAGLSGEIVRTVQQSPSAPDVFVAGTRGGVFRSSDGGQSWQRDSPEGDPELRNVDSIAIDPGDSRIVYVGTYHLPWKTLDAGQSWQPVAAGMIDDSDIMSLRVDAASHQRVFASACSGIYRSENGGARWTKLQGIPYSARRTQSIVQDPRDPRIVYAATSEGLWVTRDGGESWTRTTPRDWVVNDLVVRPASADAGGGDDPAKVEVLLGTEAQGVLISADEAVTFTPANGGFSHRIAAGLVADPSDSQHLLAWLPGAPDALVETRDGGLTWGPLLDRTPAGSGPPDVARIFAAENGWWVATARGALFSYDDGAARWTPWRFEVAAPSTSLRKRAGRPPAPRLGRSAVTLRSTPEATAAAPASPADIFDIRSAGARIFIGTRQTLWGGTLGEATLRPNAVGRPPVAPAGAATDDATSMWMAGGGKIVFTADAGKSWNEELVPWPADMRGAEVRWIRVGPFSAMPLADSRTAAVAAVPSPPLLAATTKGLYRRTESGQPWQLVQNGLPAAEPVASFFGAGLCVIAMRTGGLYLSRDGALSWERLDLGSESGLFTGAARTSDGSLLAVSLTEGLLRLPAGQIP
jgi:photosystem II stability/assembly factor-like uncharacterized protein